MLLGRWQSEGAAANTLLHPAEAALAETAFTLTRSAPWNIDAQAESTSAAANQLTNSSQHGRIVLNILHSDLVFPIPRIRRNPQSLCPIPKLEAFTYAARISV
jgi:hypothetical protein